MARFAKVAFLVLALLAPCLQPALAEDDVVTVDPDTETLIHGGLEYLARNQGINGSWSEGGKNSEPVAMTAYALIAFLSAGNLPDEGEYGRNVTSGMQYLLNEIEPTGLFRDVQQGKYMYSHGIATVALSELYGQTRSQVIGPRLEQLVRVIVDGQSPVGGWRYRPGARDADVSITVSQLAALRAAKNAGLDVPQATIDRAVAFIARCYDPGQSGFAYQPGGPAGFARTAAAIYSLQLCGKYDDPAVGRGSDYLFAHGDETEKWWPYGCYYAAPAEYMIGGDSWRRWYARMKARFASTVIREGDADHWDEKRSAQLGPIYDTAVFVTILAMPYHYIPLYQR